MKLTSNCEICQKPLIEVSRLDLGTTYLITYKCGHFFTRDRVSAEVSEVSEVSEDKYPGIPTYLPDGKTLLYGYQRENIQHAKLAKFHQIINDDTGTGKTVSAIGIISHFKLYPTLILCKKKIKIQWLVELMRKANLLPLVLEGSKDIPVEGFHCYIASYDSLNNNEALIQFPWKLILLDECQAIKNMSAKRTQAVQTIVRYATGLSIPRTLKTEPRDRQIVKVIANDLMTYHGVADRFELCFEEFGLARYEVLGLTESYALKENEGIIKGRITLSEKHVENDSLEDIIDTILHEIAHAITPGAGHSKIWSDCAVAIGGDGKATTWCKGTTLIQNTKPNECGVIGMSATPIKNHAGEYFPILNLVRSDRYSNYEAFLRNDVNTYNDGQYKKIGGLRYPKEFLQENSDFIIRHRREDVLKDLPPVRRTNKFFPLADKVKQAYQKILDEFSDLYESTGGNPTPQDQGCILGFLTKMRYLTGISKVESVVELALSFLEETEDENRKLTIFHHHEDVGNLLVTAFRAENITPLRFWKQDPNLDKMIALTTSYHWPSSDPSRRLLIAPILASGEAINLHACSDAIMAEREWNPSNEDQAAPGRFLRIGTKADMIDITFVNAINTIDEMLTTIVERKREEVGKSLDGFAVNMNEQSIIKELSAILFRENRGRWRA